MAGGVPLAAHLSTHRCGSVALSATLDRMLDSDLERLKLSAALMIAPKHRELTPSSEKLSCPPEKRITWRQWWEVRFRDDYAKFVRENLEHFKPKTEPANERHNQPNTTAEESRHPQGSEREETASS
jgi:hypothetical protein